VIPNDCRRQPWVFWRPLFDCPLQTPGLDPPLFMSECICNCQMIPQHMICSLMLPFISTYLCEQERILGEPNDRQQPQDPLFHRWSGPLSVLLSFCIVCLWTTLEPHVTRSEASHMPFEIKQQLCANVPKSPSTTALGHLSESLPQAPNF